MPTARPLGYMDSAGTFTEVASTDLLATLLAAWSGTGTSANFARGDGVLTNALTGNFSVAGNIATTYINSNTAGNAGNLYLGASSDYSAPVGGSYITLVGDSKPGALYPGSAIYLTGQTTTAGHLFVSPNGQIQMVANNGGVTLGNGTGQGTCFLNLGANGAPLTTSVSSLIGASNGPVLNAVAGSTSLVSLAVGGVNVFTAAAAGMGAYTGFNFLGAGTSNTALTQVYADGNAGNLIFSVPSGKYCIGQVLGSSLFSVGYSLGAQGNARWGIGFYGATGATTGAGFAQASGNIYFNVSGAANSYVLQYAGTVGQSFTSTGQTITGTTATDGPTLGANLLGVGGWTSTGWTGSAGGPYTNGASNTTPLTNTLAGVVATKYTQVVTITSRTAGSVVVGFGGNTTAALTATGTAYFQATTTGTLTVTPTTDFDGTVSVNVQSYTAPASSVFSIRDSSNTTRMEIRSSAAANNTYIGLLCGSYSTTGVGNTGTGVASLFSNLSGNYNVANGYQSLFSNTTGYNNVATGPQSLYSNTTGNNNVATGYQSGYNPSPLLQTLSYCSFFGYNANASIDGITNSTALGNTAQVTASNQVVIGNTAVVQTYLRGALTLGVAGSHTTGLTEIITDGTPTAGGNLKIYAPTGKAKNTYISDILTENLSSTGMILYGSAANDLPSYGSNLLTSSGWTSTGWTGSFAAGYTNGASNTTALTNSTAATIGTKYQITWTVTGATAGTFSISLGGKSFASSASGAYGPTAVSVAGLSISPTSAFNGTIVVQINTITAPSAAVLSLKSSDSNSRWEAHAPTAGLSTFTGLSSGGYVTTGIQNCGFGYFALANLTTGQSNVGTGTSCLLNLTTGSNQTCSGNTSFFDLIDGNGNTGMGFQSGYNSGVPLRALNYCTFIGYGANSSVDGISNSTAIGLQAQVTASNQIQLGNAFVTAVNTSGKIGNTTAANPVQFAIPTPVAVATVTATAIPGLTTTFRGCIEVQGSDGSYGRFQLPQGSTTSTLVYGSATVLGGTPTAGKWGIDYSSGWRFNNQTAGAITFTLIEVLTGIA